MDSALAHWKRLQLCRKSCHVWDLIVISWTKIAIGRTWRSGFLLFHFYFCWISLADLLPKMLLWAPPSTLFWILMRSSQLNSLVSNPSTPAKKCGIVVSDLSDTYVPFVIIICYMICIESPENIRTPQPRWSANDVLHLLLGPLPSTNCQQSLFRFFFFFLVPILIWLCIQWFYWCPCSWFQ